MSKLQNGLFCVTFAINAHFFRWNLSPSGLKQITTKSYSRYSASNSDAQTENGREFQKPNGGKTFTQRSLPLLLSLLFFFPIISTKLKTPIKYYPIMLITALALHMPLSETSGWIPRFQKVCVDMRAFVDIILNNLNLFMHI